MKQNVFKIAMTTIIVIPLGALLFGLFWYIITSGMYHGY